MNNYWLDRRVRRKAITMGMWVYWDHHQFKKADMDLLKQKYGDQPFLVLGLPYMTQHWGMPFGPMVDIGRNGMQITSTLSANLIRV